MLLWPRPLKGSLHGLFLFDRQTVRAYVDSHAFGLFSILVELITERGDDDH